MTASSHNARTDSAPCGLGERLRRVRPVASRASALDALPSAIAARISPRLAERLARLRPHEFPRGSSERSDQAVAARLGADVLAHQVIVLRETLALPHVHGICTLDPEHRWRSTSGLDRALRGEGPLCFLDTETNGVAGGAGTVAFMVGLLVVQGASASLTRWVLTGFEGEAAMLRALVAAIDRDARLVSYNGKSFDVPLLDTRLRLLGIEARLSDRTHLDLLHWMRSHRSRGRQDCRLRTVEEAWLGVQRDDDIEGHAIPAVWRHWLESRALEPMRRVLAHNRIDLLSLAALLQRAVEHEPDDLLRSSALTQRVNVRPASHRWSSHATRPWALRSMSKESVSSNTRSG